MYAMILLFVNFTTQDAAPSQNVFLFPSKETCQTAAHDSAAYQRGVHATDGYLVGAYCLPVIIENGKQN
jgi:hypothetical protein